MSPFDEAYLGVPPWEIGRPQPAFQTLFDRGRIRGRVLDVGCGTGEHTLLAASRGLDVLGIDSSGRALEIARRKAKARGLNAHFELGDALQLGRLRTRFHTAIDSGLFHMLSAAHRFAYARSLSSTLAPGATVYLLCFSELEPTWGGPHRIRRVEIEEAFSSRFVVQSVDPARFATRHTRPGAAAWLTTIVHVGKHLGGVV